MYIAEKHLVVQKFEKDTWKKLMKMKKCLKISRMKTKSAIKEHEMFKSQVCKDQFEAKIEVEESQKSK